MSVHCRCWVEAEPCCWCLDDTEDVEGGPTLPPCTRTRQVDCIADIRTELWELDARLFDAIQAKEAARA